MTRGTDVSYNGIRLRNVWTREFSQTPVRDESNTDLWYWKFLIRVESIVNADAMRGELLGASSLSLTGLIDSPAEIMAALRHVLAQDRQEFIYAIDEKELLRANAFLDCNNGPKVVHLNIGHVSPRTFRIEFSVEVCSIQCGGPGAEVGAGGGRSPVINNRWSSMDDIDEHGRTTRHWRGKLRVSHSINNPHTFRGLCVPPLARGFRRKGMHFTCEANGLELGYEVVDEELLGQAAPSPALRMSATHTESCGIDALNSIGDIRVRLDGPKGADKFLILQRAQQIAFAKLQIRGPSKKCHVLQVVCTDHMSDDECGVEVQIRVRHQPGGDGEPVDLTKFLGGTVLKDFGKPFELPDYDPQTATLVGPYATAPLVASMACFLQTPCSTDHGMDQSNIPPEEKEDKKKRDKKTKTEIKYTEGNPADPDYINPYFSLGQLNAIYDFYQIDSRIEKSYNRLHSAIAGSGDSSQDLIAQSAFALEMSPPTARRIVKLSGERLGAWPEIFRDEDFNSSQGVAHRILHFEPVPRAPKLSADGKTFLYAIDATYVWALDRAPLPGEPLPVGSLPWDRSVSAHHVVPSSSMFSPVDPKGLA